MEAIRKAKREVKSFKVGDQIVLGRYTATAVAQDETGTTFCFDQVYGEKPTAGPGDEKRAVTLYKSKAMDSVRDLLVPFSSTKFDLDYTFRSPTAEEIWPKQFLKSVLATEIAGADKRWEYMKDAKNQVGYTVDGKVRPYWTCSVVGYDSPKAREGSNVYFVGGDRIDSCETGHLDYGIYWRPVFKLKV